MLGQRRRRLTNISPTLGYRHVFADPPSWCDVISSLRFDARQLSQIVAEHY